MTLYAHLLVFIHHHPGCSHDSGVGSNWQGVVTNISPGTCHRDNVTSDNVRQVASTTDCEVFPFQLD